MRETNRGFTLIELMLVVSIIGLLAAIAIPKFANMIVKAKEASVKGKLGSLRSALALYYANNEGMYPPCGGATTDIGCLPVCLVPMYMSEIPWASIPTATHLETRGVRFFPPWGVMFPEWVGGGGPGNDAAWYYQSTPWMGFWDGDRVQVYCSHLDSRGVPWSTH